MYFKCWLLIRNRKQLSSPLLVRFTLKPSQRRHSSRMTSLVTPRPCLRSREGNHIFFDSKERLFIDSWTYLVMRRNSTPSFKDKNWKHRPTVEGHRSYILFLWILIPRVWIPQSQYGWEPTGTHDPSSPTRSNFPSSRRLTDDVTRSLLVNNLWNHPWSCSVVHKPP